MLAYCRSAHDVPDWVAVTGAVLDAASMLLAFGVPSEARGAAGLLHATGAEAVRGIARILHVRGTAGEAQSDAAAARDALHAAGWDLVDAPDLDRYRALRAAYQGELAALAQHLAMPTAPKPRAAAPIA
jgi:hypothetical protein